MINICIYFQVHQPFRLRQNYSFFDIGKNHDYEDVELNANIVRKVAHKCYLPTNALILDLIHRFDGRFRVGYSISGVALEQFENYAPEVLESFQKLYRTDAVEFLSETYYHSLSFLFSKEEFRQQVTAHQKKMSACFGKFVPKSFRNTELIYNNDLAQTVEKMGYEVILAEGANQILGWRSPNFLYQPKPCNKLSLLLKNYRFSDDVAFRFSDRNWNEWPLTVDKYLAWMRNISGSGELINLFMDYETFGEHQWEETGIFSFLHHFPEKFLGSGEFAFQTPSEAAATHQPMAKIDAPQFFSWADLERDTTAWLGNHLQDSASEYLYAIKERILKTGHEPLIHDFRKLQTSDHFYYMCTKWFSDGDVHKYFNPYSSPYSAYIIYVNALNDMVERLKGLECL